MGAPSKRRTKNPSPISSSDSEPPVTMSPSKQAAMSSSPIIVDSDTSSDSKPLLKSPSRKRPRGHPMVVHSNAATSSDSDEFERPKRKRVRRGLKPVEENVTDIIEELDEDG